MSTFPKLKTDAVLQYPTVSGLKFANARLRFVDGREQRFRTQAAALRRWEVQLDLLDESETAELEAFFAASEGVLGSFQFTDPWDGTEYPDCSLERDGIEVVKAAEMRGRTVLRIRENVR